MKTFSERVVKLAMSIPKSRVTTYGRIAKAAGGGSMASRSITAILYKAWQSGNHKIPWHRIVYTDGKYWTDSKHKKERLALYKKEKIEIEGDKIKDFKKLVFEFK
jgi:methylated-DNA-protein-cysteine methyltransferase related protein